MKRIRQRELALQAEYEAQHAHYLNSYIQNLNNERKSREEVILSFENELKKVTAELQIPAQFDKGHGQVINSIVDKIKTLNDSLQQQSQKNQSLLTENEELQTKLSESTKERTQITERVESMSDFQARFNSVRNLFSNDEALIFREQNDAVIRLVGFNFDLGSSVIKPDHYEILTKVQKAIEMFPDSKVMIQGHTDSQGSDNINLKLSQARANAVMSYLLANMNIEPSRLEAIGYGASKPIANNDTEQGRKLNRRIDVVIKPVIGLGSR